MAAALLMPNPEAIPMQRKQSLCGKQSFWQPGECQNNFSKSALTAQLPIRALPAILCVW